MNMIQSAKDQVLALTTAAYQKASAAGLLPEGVTVTPSVEIPKDTANGDYTTTFCLAAAKAMKMNPRQVAQILTEQMDLTDTYFTSVELAGPGFLNFRLGSRWFGDTVACVEAEGADYGRNDTLTGKKYMVEFVSANPTGPMHMGNARGGVLGDTLASVLQKSGADVWREFYVNDAGNQIDKFARSLDARYQQLIRGEDAVEFPEDGYHGDDIRELARLFYQQEGEKYLDCDEKTRHDALAKFGLDHNIPKMKTDLARYGIQYDAWFFESTLHESGYVADSVKALTQRGYTYEKDGALWLKTADILRDHFRKQGKKEADIEKLDLKDDVLRRANGFYTYFAATGFTYGSTPANWKKMQAWAERNGKVFIPCVGPGYIDTRVRPWNGSTTRDRGNGKYYDDMFGAAVASGAPYIGITSFNEWHEGTQIEPAVPFSCDAFTYLDYSPLAPDYYLTRTAYLISNWKK